jgi:hypothetical protein
MIEREMTPSIGGGMFRRIAGSTHPTLVAYLALFIVLGGGTAFAAKHYLITSTRQIKPNVLRALHGATGATGPVLTVLSPGETETGSYDAEGTATAIGDLASASISFAIPLASSPTPTIVTSGTTAACLGSVTAPTAAPGQLCIYEGGGENIGEIGAHDPVNGNGGSASPYGAGLVVDSSGMGNFYSDGTWAVTAP